MTPTGVEVDADGCRKRLQETRRFDLDAQFASGSARLIDLGDISEVLALLAQYPEARLSVEGHTDSAGADATNQVLSQRRAEAVTRVLIDEFDVDASRITSLGHGETQPKADNATAEGRAANRRVELIVRPAA